MLKECCDKNIYDRFFIDSLADILDQSYDKKSESEEMDGIGRKLAA
jgi:hypothetical protein